MSYNKTISALFFGKHPYLSAFKSDVHLGFASANITFLGLTNPDVILKRMHQLHNVVTSSALYISFVHHTF